MNEKDFLPTFFLNTKFNGKVLELVNLALPKCLSRFQRKASLERFIDSHYLLEEESPNRSSMAWRDKSSLDSLER